MVIRGLKCLRLITLPCHAYSVTADLTWDEIEVSILSGYFSMTSHSKHSYCRMQPLSYYFQFGFFCLFDHVKMTRQN